jgi:hypothetical protein
MIAGGERGKMAPELPDGDLGPEANRRDDGARSLWFRAARLVFAALCVVVAALAGGASGRLSPASIGAAPGTAPTADALSESGRNVLRPHAEIVAKAPIWRAIDAGGPQPDPHFGAILAPWQSVAWLAGSELGFSRERGPRWLAVRAGFSRAPPTAIGRSRIAA